MTLLEVCVDSSRGLIAARDGGADRIELCSRLEVGGLTPARPFLVEALATTTLPLHVMLRPRAGDFVYARDELDALETELDFVRTTNARGVVFGALTNEREIDVAATRRLVERARPLSVTFHRAFDEVRDHERALDALISLGAERVLTSGGSPTAWEGRAKLRALIAHAAGRIVVMPGGGVREHNASALIAETGAVELHSSTPFHLRRNA